MGVAVVKLLHLPKVIIVFWLASWMMSRWLHYPDWVTIIAQQVLMNVVSVMQADCRMNLLEIFLRWLMRKIFHVRLLPAVSTQPNCLNQLLLFFFSHPGELSARSGDALQKAFTDKEELLKQQASNLHEQKKAGVIFEAEEVITLLTSVLKTSSASRTSLSSRHQFALERQYCIRAIKWCLTLDRSVFQLSV